MDTLSFSGTDSEMSLLLNGATIFMELLRRNKQTVRSDVMHQLHGLTGNKFSKLSTVDRNASLIRNVYLILIGRNAVPEGVLAKMGSDKLAEESLRVHQRVPAVV
jgi:hypothetical protein